MKFLDTLKSAFGAQPSASTLAPPPLPKAPNAPQSLPGYRKNTTASKSALRETERSGASLERVAATRNLSKTKQQIRLLSKVSPELASAISSLLRTGIPERYTLIARDLDGQIDPAATSLAQELLRRLTFLGNVDGSYGAQMTIQSLSEQLAYEILVEGACALEVALDKARIPASFNPIAVSTLKAYEDGNTTRFVQLVGGHEIDLDTPTFIYTSLDQDLLEAYSASPLEAALQPVLSDIDFNNDVRKALKRAVLPRLTATIDSEKVKRFVPPEILSDAEKFAAYKQALIEEVESTINSLGPEDALVSYDSITYSYIDGGKDPGSIITKIQDALNAKLSSGAKTLPVVLGHGASSNASSTEAVLYLKQANILRVKLNEIYSRAFTVAIRLMGVDGYAEFKFESLDLRPEKELEAFKAMEQSRILELLSLGLLTDAEACVQLTGNLPPPGMKPLSGTGFKAGSANIQNPTSNTSAVEQSSTPKTPKNAKSSNGGNAGAEIETAFAAQSAKLAEVHASNLASAASTANAAISAAERNASVLSDMAYAMSQQAQKPVQVSVEAQPVTISLQMEQEKKAPNKRVKIVRDEEGRVSHMEVVEESHD